MDCGTTPLTIATQQSEAWGGIVTDSVYVYWSTNAFNTSAPGQIMRCPINGCTGAPTVLANTSLPWGIVQDETAIYWSDSTGIKKLAK
jgi:hypothetical protein